MTSWKGIILAGGTGSRLAPLLSNELFFFGSVMVRNSLF